MRDVNNGWLVRYIHSNTASAFFLLVLYILYYCFYFINFILNPLTTIIPLDINMRIQSIFEFSYKGVEHDKNFSKILGNSTINTYNQKNPLDSLCDEDFFE